MEYDIGPTSDWIEVSPQTGESSLGHAKAIVLAAVSLSSGVCLPVLAYEHTGYGTPITVLDASFVVNPKPKTVVSFHAFNAESVTERLKRVFGLSISRQAQILNVSRTAIYNWRKGEEPTEKNLEVLSDLNGAAELFESEGIHVTGLLMKRPFFQGKSLLDLMGAGVPISQSAKQLVEQLRRESEERHRLVQRFGSRQASKVDHGLDLE